MFFGRRNAKPQSLEEKEGDSHLAAIEKIIYNMAKNFCHKLEIM